MDNMQRRMLFLRKDFIKHFKRILAENNQNYGNFGVKVKHFDEKVFYSFQLSPEVGIAITYSFKDELFASLTKLGDVNDKEGKVLMAALHNGLAPEFGRPTLGYEADSSYPGVKIKALEWAQKEREKQAVKEVRGGVGLELYPRVYNIVDFTKEDSGQSENS